MKNKVYAVAVNITFESWNDTDAKAKAKEIASVNTGLGIEANVVLLSEVISDTEIRKIKI